MFKSIILSCVLFSAIVACGPKEESKTVTHSDSTTTDGNGRVDTKSSTSDVHNSDGSNQTTKTQEVNAQPPAK